ncbi:hypothetical protein ACOSP7_001993 [Xanthoceras sorbifolium]
MIRVRSVRWTKSNRLKFSSFLFGNSLRLGFDNLIYHIMSSGISLPGNLLVTYEDIREVTRISSIPDSIKAELLQRILTFLESAAL